MANKLFPLTKVIKAFSNLGVNCALNIYMWAIWLELRMYFFRHMGFNMGLSLQGSQEKSLKSITYLGIEHKPNKSDFF